MNPIYYQQISRSAANDVKRLSRKRKEAIAQAFDRICNVSPLRHPNPTVIKPLKGEYKGLWRYRVGDIRIIYAVNEEKRVIRIISIDNRGNVY